MIIKDSSLKFKSALFKSILLIWTIFIIVNYLIHHPVYLNAIVRPPYLATILILIGFSASVFFLTRKRKWVVRGWMIYLFGIICMLIIYNGYAVKQGIYSHSVLSHSILFLIKNIYFHLGCVLLIAVSSGVGTWFMKFFPFFPNTHINKILSIALGVICITSILFILATIKILSSWVVIPILLLLVILRYKSIIDFVKYLFWKPIGQLKNDPTLFILISFVIVIAAFNLVGSIKLFPIGFDGSVLYQNTSSLLGQTGQFVKGGQAYNWSLFTTLGFLFFGSMNFSILLTHIVGLLCIWVLYHLGRSFLTKKYTWIAISCFYILPGMSYHNFVDEKVDLAFLFFMLSVLVAFTKYAEKIKFNFAKPDPNSARFFILLGVLMGFSMGIKYLTILSFISLISILIYNWGGFKAIISCTVLFIGILFFLNISNFSNLQISAKENWLITLIFSVTGLTSMIYMVFSQKKESTIQLFKNVLILSLSTLFVFSPWIVKNSIESGKISRQTFFYSKLKKSDSQLNYKWLEQNNIPYNLRDRDRIIMLEHLGLDESTTTLNDSQIFANWEKIQNKKLRNEIRRSTKNRKGKREEMQRYLGYENELPRLISIPFDITMSTNIPNKRGTDFGFLYLLILPLLFFGYSKNKKQFLKKCMIGGLLFLFLFVSWKASLDNVDIISISEYLVFFNPISSQFFPGIIEHFYHPFLDIQDKLSNLISPFYHLISKLNYISALVIFITLAFAILYFLKDAFSKFPAQLKYLSVFTFCYALYWALFGSGIPYYAIVVWALLTFIMFFYLSHLKYFIHPDLLNFTKLWSNSILAIFIVINGIAHFSNHSNNWNEFDNLFFKPFVQYASESISQEELIAKNIPLIETIEKTINEDLEVKIYRVGTFLNFHIKNNAERVFQDNQLTKFDVINNVLKNPEDFFKVLKLKGFKYIIFDLNVASIDKTPEKSLTDKAVKFVKLLNMQNKVKLVDTDNIVIRKDPKTNKEIRTNGLIGKTIIQGTAAIFEIL